MSCLTHFLKQVVICAFLFGAVDAYSENDQQLLKKLNSEAEHDQNRRQNFKTDRNAKKIYDSEREKELALFLEQQEKWELIRERGLTEYRLRNKDQSPREGGPEYLQDEKVRQQLESKKEANRMAAVFTREKIKAKTDANQLNASELEELNLAAQRPRFDQRKRGKNKWVKGAATSGGSGSSSNSGGGGNFAPPPSAFDDFPTQPDFMPAPMDGFEEIPPPPPPPVNYDGSTGFGGVDSGFGDIPPPPPPPFLDDNF